MNNKIEFDEQGRIKIPKRKIEVTQELSELIEKSKDFKEEESYKTALTKLKEFQEKFPLDKINELTLEEYCYGFKDSFCWWVEEGTLNVAHMGHDGFNREYGIWFNDKEKEHYMKEGVRSIKIDKETAERKLKDIKRAIISIINFTKNEEFEEIESERELWHQVKTKICYLYFPDKLLPILSKEHLKKICDFIGISHYNAGNHIKSSNELLKSLKQMEPFKEWSSLKIAHFIYSNYSEMLKR